MSRDVLVQAFDMVVRARGDEPLVISPSRSMTAEGVDGLAHSIESSLCEAVRFEPGALIGLVAPNGPAFLSALVALRRLRCVALLYDWRTPEPELRRISAALGAATTLRFVRAWPVSVDELTVLEVEPDPGCPGLYGEPAIIQLTSGSTGAPRGVLKTMESILVDDRALASSMGLGRDEHILATVPMSHAYGLSTVAMPALTRGCRLVVPDEGHPLGTMQAARVGDVTFIPTVPAYLQALLGMAAPPRLPGSLKLIITAGAPLHPETARRFRKTYDRPVHVLYGASEAGGICFDREGDAAERGALGAPVDGVRVALDETAGADEAGVGVVVVESAAVALGYLPRQDRDLGGGRFCSSDLGEIRDGGLILHGRIDDLINVRGKKVRPGEVEAVLRRLEGVDEAVVIGLGGRGPEGQMVRAVVAGDSSRLDVRDVQRWCRDNLAAHKVPRGIIVVDMIPRNVRGKVDRAAVLELAATSGKAGSA